MYDVIIVGGGPAGLSAALVLGRCRRSVLVCDAGHPRNWASHGVHNFLTRDGIHPHELLRLAREDLRPYTTVEVRSIEVTDAQLLGGCFEVVLADGTRCQSKKLVLATGVVDRVPDLQGIRDLYGSSVFHCPYCDGWEVRDQALAAYGRGAQGAGLALELTAWSRDIVLCTGAPGTLSMDERDRLRRNAIAVREESIDRLEGAEGRLQRIIFAGGDTLERQALFFSTLQDQACDLPTRFGCEFLDHVAIRTNEHEAANVPGLYVAGDASRGEHLAVIAAAEGANVGIAVNAALTAHSLR